MAYQVLILLQQKQCGAIKTAEFNNYLLLVTLETNDNCSIRFAMKIHYSHSTNSISLNFQ